MKKLRKLIKIKVLSVANKLRGVLRWYEVREREREVER